MNSPWKTVQIHVHIIYHHNMLSGLHNHYYSWIHLEKQCRSIPTSYITTICSLDYIITVTVEFTLKNHVDPCLYHILPHYGWIHLKKWCRSMPISCIATICSLDYIIIVMVEFALKNGADLYPYHVLPQYAFQIT